VSVIPVYVDSDDKHPVWVPYHLYLISITNWFRDSASRERAVKHFQLSRLEEVWCMICQAFVRDFYGVRTGVLLVIIIALAAVISSILTGIAN